MANGLNIRLKMTSSDWRPIELTPNKGALGAYSETFVGMTSPGYFPHKYSRR